MQPTTDQVAEHSGVDAVRTRFVSWEDPLPTAAAGLAMRGIEYLRAIAEERFPAPPIARLLDFRIVELAEGRAVFEVTPSEQHYNPIGVVHGGLAATLLDSAMGCAVHSTLDAGEGYTTLEFKVNLVRPITAQTGPVRATSELVHAGRRTATAHARLEDAAGNLLAHASATCLIQRPER
jgi:uncharacterized protein (TIGR00369 family)